VGLRISSIFITARKTGVELWTSNYFTLELEQEAIHCQAKHILPDDIQESSNGSRSLEQCCGKGTRPSASTYGRTTKAGINACSWNFVPVS
jgi:hypothetical protein